MAACSWLLAVAPTQRRGDVLMHNQPLPPGFLPDHGPAEIAVTLAAIFHYIRVMDGCGAPNQLAVPMDLGVVVHRRLERLKAGEYLGDALLVLRPTVVLQRSDIEKDVRTFGVIFGHIGGITCTPTGPDGIH